MARLIATLPLNYKKRAIKHPLLNSMFIVDTGFQLNVACPNAIRRLKELGYTTQKYQATATVLCSGHPSRPKSIYSIDFPLFNDLFKGQPFIKDWMPKKNIIGVPLLKQCVIEVLDSTINFYDTAPDKYSEFVQLKQPEEERYYITLKVDGKEDDYLFDTGHCVPLVMPYELHTISPDAVPGNCTWTFGDVDETMDDYRSTNLPVHLGDRTFIPEIAYFTKELAHPYAMNPFYLFKGTPFIIDLNNSRIGFKPLIRQ